MKTASAFFAFFAIGIARVQAEESPSPLAPVVQSFVERKMAPGIVTLVADRDGILAIDRAGDASMANKTPVRDAAVFWIASMSKSLIGAALEAFGKDALPVTGASSPAPPKTGARAQAPTKPDPAKPEPTMADVPFGPHPHQLMDVYLPKQGEAPYPALFWFGGIWKAAKHPANLGFFGSKGIAVIAVQVRTMEDAVVAKEPEPISYVQRDAVRAVQFARLHAEKWGIDPERLAVGGGSQGAQPALFVGCSRDQANPSASDPVERQSSLVTCVAAYRCQPTLDPVRMQEWVPGVKWGAPALGMSFEESLKRRDELLPVLQRWSPDYLLHRDAAPIFFENEWGLTRPDDIGETNYDVHSPRWALGFQKLAHAAGATCYVKFPGHPADEAAKDIWDFVVKQLKFHGRLR